MFASLLGLGQLPVSPPPRRARWKAPVSYHFLAAGYDKTVAVASTGRARKVTTWALLEKAQSVRRVQGPVQRAFKLASVHVDVAGRRVRAEFRDRDVQEADALFQKLVLETRLARRHASGQADAPLGPVAQLEELGPLGSAGNSGEQSREVGDGTADGTDAVWPTTTGQPLPPPPAP